MSKKITIIYNNNIFDITNFIKNHPGEGINNIYLKDFNNKDVTKLFEHYHYTNDAFEILDLATKKGSYKGVLYLGGKN